MIKYPFTKEDIPENFDRNAYDEVIEWFNDDKIVSHLYEIIHNKIFHRCSLQSFFGIIKDGCIVQNTGQFETTYPQTEGNIGYTNKWISLFNFNKNPFEIVSTYDRWRRFLTDMPNCTLLIILKSNLEETLVKNPYCKKNKLSHCHCIPYVEEWSTVPISFDFFERIVFVPSRHPHQYISCTWESVKKTFTDNQWASL